jgi:heat shock protein HtpX
MKYVGLHTQIGRNNRKSALLLVAFPAMILVGVYAVLGFLNKWDFTLANGHFLSIAPIVLIAVAVWFVIAYFFHTKLIQMATHSVPLERKDNMRVYNLTENLCMSVGMKMPKLFIIESPALNAYASGINEKSYAVTVTRGLIDSLTDEELEGVIAHELTHIRNNDVRLLIVTIVFVGIFGVIVDIAFRSFLYGGNNRRRNDKDNSGAIMLVILLVAVVLYFLSMIFKFALSRSREYMADAGAVEMTKNAPAMANALRKVSGNSQIKTTNDEVKELFIDNSSEQTSSFFSSISNIFATHPPIEKRIQVLEQF